MRCIIIAAHKQLMPRRMARRGKNFYSRGRAMSTQVNTMTQESSATLNVYDRPLVLPTKIMLVIWSLVTGLGGLAMMFIPGFATTFVYPPPLDPMPQFNAGLYGALAFATGVASVYALRKNKWAFAAPVIAMYLADDIFQQIVAVQRILQGPVPLQVWFYVALGLVYFVLIYFSYKQQGSI
jgi:hypothetical protein